MADIDRREFTSILTAVGLGPGLASPASAASGRVSSVAQSRRT